MNTFDYSDSSPNQRTGLMPTANPTKGERRWHLRCHRTVPLSAASAFMYLKDVGTYGNRQQV